MATLVTAHHLYQQGQYAAAAAQCDELLMGPSGTNLSMLLLASACKFMLRDLPASLAYSKRAIKLDPSFAEAYGNAGTLMMWCAVVQLMVLP